MWICTPWLDVFFARQQWCRNWDFPTGTRANYVYILLGSIKTVTHTFEPMPIGLVSLFNGISTFVGYLMPKLFSEKNSSGTI